MLTRDGRIIRALVVTGPDTPVLAVMERDVVTINCHAPLSDAVALQASARPLLGIDDEARVVGIITLGEPSGVHDGRCGEPGMASGEIATTHRLTPVPSSRMSYTIPENRRYRTAVWQRRTLGWQHLPARTDC